jgi:integrase
MTLQEFSNYYLENYCKVRNRSWKCKRSSLRALNMKLGDVALSDLSPSHLDSYFRSRKEEGASAATMNRDLAYLKHLMRCAEERGLIEVNRIANVRKFREPKKERPRPTDDDVDRLLASADPCIRPLLGFMRETGCRLGEALALKRTQIRRSERLVVFTDNTKSGKFRVVPLTDDALRWIDELPELPGCPYVFYNPKSRTRWHCVRRRINKAIAASGLEWRILAKDLRRHYGITLAESGAEMHVIQAMLGHHSVKTTEDYYAHFSPHYAARRALEVLEGRKQRDGRQTGGQGLDSRCA